MDLMGDNQRNEKTLISSCTNDGDAWRTEQSKSSIFLNALHLIIWKIN